MKLKNSVLLNCKCSLFNDMSVYNPEDKGVIYNRGTIFVNVDYRYLNALKEMSNVDICEY